MSTAALPTVTPAPAAPPAGPDTGSIFAYLTPTTINRPTPHREVRHGNAPSGIAPRRSALPDRAATALGGGGRPGTDDRESQPPRGGTPHHTGGGGICGGGGGARAGRA